MWLSVGSRFIKKNKSIVKWPFLFYLRWSFPDLSGQNLFALKSGHLRLLNKKRNCHFNIFLFFLIHLLRLDSHIHIDWRISFPFYASDNPYSIFRQRQLYPIIFQRPLSVFAMLFFHCHTKIQNNSSRYGETACQTSNWFVEPFLYKKITKNYLFFSTRRCYPPLKTYR